MQSEHKIRTLAHQLAEILSVYARSLQDWREDPSDLGRYERLQGNLELVRVLTEKAFPGGRGELGELLLCHADLKLLVLRGHMGLVPALSDEPSAQLQGLLRRHGELVEALSLVCRQRSGPSTPSAALASASVAATVVPSVSLSPAALGGALSRRSGA